MELVPTWRWCTLRPEDSEVLFRETVRNGDYFGPVLDCKWNPNAAACMAILTSSGAPLSGPV